MPPRSSRARWPMTVLSTVSHQDGVSYGQGPAHGVFRRFTSTGEIQLVPDRFSRRGLHIFQPVPRKTVERT